MWETEQDSNIPDDCISRREAIRIASGYCHPANVAKELRNLPPVLPERPKAHWVWDENGLDWNIPAWVCSRCGLPNTMIPTYIRRENDSIRIENPYVFVGSRFCAECGAEMKKEKPDCEEGKQV